MKASLFAIALVPALFLPGCGDSEPPPEAAAEQSLENFGEAVDAMREDKEQLQQEVEGLQETFREGVEKLLVLQEQRLATYESRLIKLPAEREVEMRKTYTDLTARVGQLRQLYAQWSQAQGEQAAQVRAQVDEARRDLVERFNQFDQQLEEAEPGA